MLTLYVTPTFYVSMERLMGYFGRRSPVAAVGR
jgi:hypothetical protein